MYLVVDVDMCKLFLQAHRLRQIRREIFGQARQKISIAGPRFFFVFRKIAIHRQRAHCTIAVLTPHKLCCLKIIGRVVNVIIFATLFLCG